MNLGLRNIRFARRGWPRIRTGVALALVALVFAAALVAAACAPAAGQSHTLYRCPMHPDYVSDKPGDCPICGMRLVPFEKGSAPPQPPSAAAKQIAIEPREPAVVHTANDAAGSGPGLPDQSTRQPAVVEAARQQQQQPPPQQPQQQQQQQQERPRPPSEQAPPPMPDMPGMPGMPAPPQTGKPSPPSSAGTGQHSGGTTNAALAPVHLDAEQARLAGVRTIAATAGTLAGTIRAVGTVVMPETGVRQVTTKVAGWVQKLYVNSTGRPVRAGEPLFDLYSPELLASQEEYLHAKQVASQFAGSTVPEVRRGGQDLLTAARRRLELFDVPPQFLAHLDETGQAQRTVTFRAPFSGYVMDKAVVEGQRVEPGMNLMTIADLSRAWVTAQIYEAEAAVAQPGRTARIWLPYDDTVQLAGRIDLVYPTVDTESRTIKVRIQLPNPRLALKPGMFVNVELETERAHGVVVPDTAVIDTGTRQVVFVQSQPGQFEPRDVKAGLRTDGKVVLRSGVAPGEQVVAAANFLIDSESRLRGAVR